MKLFYYGFSMALSIALGVAIGNAWVRDHDYGVWTRKFASILTIIVIAFGLILGWAMETWLTWAFNSSSVRVP